MTTTHPRTGIALVLLAAALWGTTGTAREWSHAGADSGLTAAWFGALRLAVAAAFFAALSLAPGFGRAPAQSGRAAPGGFVLAGVCMAVYNLAFFAGIQRTGVALGTALALGSGPLWAGGLQALASRRWPSVRWCIGTALAVAGGTAMAGAWEAEALAVDGGGVALCLAAGLSYAVYADATQRLGAVAPALVVTRRAFAVAALLAVSAAGWQAGVPQPTRGDLLAVAYVGLVTAGIAYLLFAMALRHLPAATAVTLALLEPVVACLLAATLLGEVVTQTGWLGLGLVLAGVAVVVRGAMRPPASGPHARA